MIFWIAALFSDDLSSRPLISDELTISSGNVCFFCFHGLFSLLVCELPAS